MARHKKRTIKIGDILHTSGKIVKIGNAVGITLPKEWVEEHGLKVGDRVYKVANSMITINPKPITEGE